MTKEEIKRKKRRDRRLARAKKTAAKPSARVKVTAQTVARARQPRKAVNVQQINPFKLPEFPPGIAPEKGASPAMAMDDMTNVSAALAWAEQQATWSDGLQFLGYAFLAELSQRAEYRLVSERLAYEMTRKWIKFQTANTENDKTEQIKQLTEAFEAFKVKDKFKTLAEQDGYFGRTHLYVDVGDAHEDRDELKTGIGDGTSALSRMKVKKGKLKRLVVVEPMWCYPTNYNANDPTSPTWYRPETWLMMGKEIHATRLMPFVGRPVADILKPAYAFGGLSLSQIVKFYVDKWLRNVNSVADMIDMFSTSVLQTDMQSQLSGTAEDFFNRIDLFTTLRQNRGVLVTDKNSEDFKNVSTPLGTLDVLLAQSLEHIAAASHIPVVILLGLSPAGLNASSEGELRAFYDWVFAYQEAFFRPGLTKVMHFIQLHLWGQVDPEITFAFEPLWAMDDKAKADMRKTEADTDVALVGANILSPEEARKRIASDPDTPYQGLNVDDVPEPTDEEAEEFESGEVGEDAVIPFDVLERAKRADKLRFLRDFDNVKRTTDKDQWDSFYSPDDDSITLESKFDGYTSNAQLEMMLHEAGHRGAYRIQPDLFSAFKRDHLNKLEDFKQIANPTHMHDYERTGHVDDLAQEVFAESYARWCLDIDMPEELRDFWDSTRLASDEAGFEESKHPRDKGGQFASKGGGGGGVATHPDKTAKSSSQVPFVTLRTKLKELVAGGFYGKPEAEKEAHSLARQLVHGYMLKIKELMNSGKAHAVEAAAGKAKKYSKHLPHQEKAQFKKDLEAAVASSAPAPAPESKQDQQVVKEMTQSSVALQPQATPAQTQQYTKEETEAFNDLVGMVGSAEAKSFAAKAKSKIGGKYKNLTPAEAAHILAYTGSYYGGTNAALRAGVMDETRWRHVRALNKSLDKLPDHQGTVWRKAALTPEIAAMYKPGMIVEERGFTSTSKNMNTWSGTHYFEITSKSGKDISGMSLHTGEAEVLFQSGSRFKIVSRDGHKIKMEQVE